MTTDQITNFLNAVESTEIKAYSLSDDMNNKYYNNDTSICIFDDASETLVNIRKTLLNGIADNNNITFIANDIADIRKAEICGTYEQIKAFAEAYGLSLTDDQLKIIVKIDRMNKIVKPITGDYTHVYHKLSEAEYAALSEDDKANYDAIVEKDKERLEGIPTGRAAIINC